VLVTIAPCALGYRFLLLTFGVPDFTITPLSPYFAIAPFIPCFAIAPLFLNFVAITLSVASPSFLVLLPLPSLSVNVIITLNLLSFLVVLP
jgi:hypothetical protein